MGTVTSPLANILINELINPNNTNELISNYNYQMTYNCVGNNNHVHQLNWPENKMCRQINDSSYHLDNYSSNHGNWVYYDQIKWRENKMCRQLDDSYLQLSTRPNN